MKNRLLIVIGLGFAVTTVAVGDAHAQAAHYNPVRFDTGVSGSYVGASGRSGFGANFELKFMATDNIAVGARADAAVMWGGKVGEDDVEMNMAAAASALAKGEYLLGTGPVRPFAGLGLGVYTIASQTLAAGPNTAGIDQKGGRYFGVAPQIGVDLGRLRLAATYNLMLGADIEVRQMIGNVEQTASFSQNYLTFDMSIRFGGGRKRVAPPVMILAPQPAVIPTPTAPPPVAPPPAAPSPNDPPALPQDLD